MRKFIAVLLMITALLMVAPDVSSAQVLPQIVQQLVGPWEGIITAQKETRTLNVQDALTSTGGAIVLRAEYGITGKKMGPVWLSLTMNEGRPELSFTTGAGTKIILPILKPHKMEGTFAEVNKEVRAMQFWRINAAAQAPKELSQLQGTWAGSWPGGLSMVVTIKYVDSESAAVHYEWGNMTYPDGTRVTAGALWYVAKVSSEGEITFEYPGSNRVFTLKAERKYLRISLSGAGTGNPSVLIGRDN